VLANVPVGHGEQVEDPVRLANEPIAHNEHVLSAVAPRTLDAEPAGHAMHTALLSPASPVTGLYVPVGQDVHLLAAPTEEYVPAGHAAQFRVPSCRNVPAGHGTHTYVLPQRVMLSPAAHDGAM